MCQRHNNPTIVETTAEGHQNVFNAARNSRTRIMHSLRKKFRRTKLYKALMCPNSMEVKI